MSAEHDLAAERVNGADREGRPAAFVAISARSLWRIRLLQGLPRYLLYAVCVAGLVASARFALAPPGVRTAPIAAPVWQPPDRAAEGYAVLFARRYLTWDASQPQLNEQSLAPMVGAALPPAAGLMPASSGAQHVAWAEVVQVRRREAGTQVYTVAAQTDASGLVYLTVGIARRHDGTLAIDGYPAFVGAPQTSGAVSATRALEVSDPALSTVVERALRNYLAGASEELAADLSSDARVSLPDVGLVLDSLQRLSWSGDRRSVLAVVQAHDARGARFTLGYELDVAELDDRWEIAAIQTDPRS